MYFDSSYLLLIPGLLLALWAQYAVKSAYDKYSKVPSRNGMQAADAVRQMLNAGGNGQVQVLQGQGVLTDHYDPRNKTLRLSEGVYGSTSVAALGIAAHEAGHAMQDKEGYAFLGFRTAIVPVVSFGSKLSLPIFIIGLIMSYRPLTWIGIGLFALTVIFTLITLPVEFDASKRAIRMLNASGVIAGDEEQSVRKVLNAAAMTYVAAAVGAVLQLARLILLSRSRRRD